MLNSVERYQRGETSQGAEAKRLGVSQQTFQDWIRKHETFGIHRSKSSSELENEALLHDIGLIYAEHNGTYGYRRIADEYNVTHEKQYNLKRFYRLVHIVGLLAVIRRKRPAYQRSTPEVTAENILSREFTANTVNEKWCTDVTEMKYGSEGGKAYLSAILDLKGRDIVSFAIGRHNNNQLVFETLDLAIQKYPDAHPLFHSDRGFQYTSKQFKDMLEKQGMRQSMSRVGRCIDNGPMEGFWGILKCEMYYLNHFETYEELVDLIGQFRLILRFDIRTDKFFGIVIKVAHLYGFQGSWNVIPRMLAKIIDGIPI